MLKKIILRNFQIHKYLEINFKDGLNVIMGSSDTGKSSVIRAMRWVIENRPIGTNVIRRWGLKYGDEVSVEMHFENGIVIRKHQGNFNGYIIKKNEDDEGQTFNAIKGNVPVEVKNLIGLESYQLRMQHDAYFMLANTGGEIARSLNSIMNLDIIDLTHRAVESMIDEARQKSNQFEKDKQDLVDQVLQLEYLNEARNILDGLNRHILKHSEVESKSIELYNTIDEIILLQDELRQFKKLGKLQKKAEHIASHIEEYKNLYEQHQLIGDIAKRYSELSEAVPEGPIGYEEQLELYASINTQLDGMKKLHNSFKHLDDLIFDIESHTLLVEEINAEIKEQQRQLQNLASQVQECPTCGKPLDSNDVLSIYGRG